MGETKPWHPRGYSHSPESPALVIVSCKMSVPSFWNCLAPSDCGVHGHYFGDLEREAVGQQTSGVSLLWLSHLIRGSLLFPGGHGAC